MAVYGNGNLLIGEAYSRSPKHNRLRKMIRSEEPLDMDEFLDLLHSVYDSIKSVKDL